MPDLELNRLPDDRRRYVIAGVGTLRLQGFFASGAVAESEGMRWVFTRRGLLRRLVDATDAAGATVGTFEPGSLRRGGALRWGDRRLVLRPAASFRERYSLMDGDRELALLEGKSWGRRPVRLTVAADTAVEPGLLLFAAFVVRGLAEDASAIAGAAASTAATSS
jgi:hypothetical protein